MNIVDIKEMPICPISGGPPYKSSIEPGRSEAIKKAALEYLDEKNIGFALVCADRIPDPMEKISALYQIASAYKEQNDFEGAEEAVSRMGPGSYAADQREQVATLKKMRKFLESRQFDAARSLTKEQDNAPLQRQMEKMMCVEETVSSSERSAKKRKVEE